MQKSGSPLVDNGSEAIQSRRLQAIANNSHQVRQMAQLYAIANNLTAPIQKQDNLEDLGIDSAEALEKWLSDKKAEIDNVAVAHYAKLDKANEAFGIEEKVDDGKRTGLCGETCAAVREYIEKTYPAVGKIAARHSFEGGEHYALSFTYPAGGTVLVDPTYRQFDKEKKYEGESHVWVGKPDGHPFY
ncbi:hypothetical protein C900_03449 [Fulvivirga imtechensis AK7]|uniref:Uncharacterized protein n=1 Tax=Fulvivirga imtechensis AK7 TaxID=1237149 RepID=L8JNZ1_9BACT|nr:hypothetical protein [Fulvivirga imtechensis]ELR70676.1 hypothetical protein C900_03449 [Fulvivirga imtechensis AK7]